MTALVCSDYTSSPSHSLAMMIPVPDYNRTFDRVVLVIIAARAGYKLAQFFCHSNLNSQQHEEPEKKFVMNTAMSNLRGFDLVDVPIAITKRVSEGPPQLAFSNMAFVKYLGDCSREEQKARRNGENLSMSENYMRAVNCVLDRVINFERLSQSKTTFLHLGPNGDGKPRAVRRYFASIVLDGCRGHVLSQNCVELPIAQHAIEADGTIVTDGLDLPDTLFQGAGHLRMDGSNSRGGSFYGTYNSDKVNSLGRMSVGEMLRDLNYAENNVFSIANVRLLDQIQVHAVLLGASKDRKRVHLVFANKAHLELLGDTNEYSHNRRLGAYLNSKAEYMKHLQEFLKRHLDEDIMLVRGRVTWPLAIGGCIQMIVNAKAVRVNLGPIEGVQKLIMIHTSAIEPRLQPMYKAMMTSTLLHAYSDQQANQIAKKCVDFCGPIMLYNVPAGKLLSCNPAAAQWLVKNVGRHSNQLSDLFTNRGIFKVILSSCGKKHGSYELTVASPKDPSKFAVLKATYVQDVLGDDGILVTVTTDSTISKFRSKFNY